MGLVCTNMNGKATTFCPPEVIQCTETDTDGFLTICENKYCLIKCDFEKPSTVPFLRGDKIHIQTQFRDLVNTDPHNPILGWGDWIKIELWNTKAGTFVTNISNVASKYYVCHNGNNSYQVIEIDTAKIVGLGLIIPDCWELRIQAYDGTDGEAVIIDERCTNQFQLIDGCYKSHLIEGLYTELDCVSNYYGEPDCGAGQPGGTFFKYSNQTRIEGVINKKTTEIEDEDGQKTTIENYELRPYAMMSYYLIGWYSNLFSAKKIKIDGIELEIVTLPVDYSSEQDHSALPIFRWQQKCKIC